MRKITVSKVLLSSLVPISVIPVFAITNCSKTDIAVSNITAVVNKDSGGADFELSLPKQPSDGKVEVTVVDVSGEHGVQLYTDNQKPYYGSNTAIFPVQNRKIKIHTCFNEFIGKSASTTFGLSIKYVGKQNAITTSVIDGLKLELNYDPQPAKEEVHLYNINDFHAAAAGFGDDYFNPSSKNPGAIRVAQEISPLLEKYPGSVFLTSGDNNSGEAFSTCTHGETLYPILSAMGARYSAVGNHAFEWGMDYLEKYQFDKWARTDQTQGNYLISGNILNGTMYRQQDWQADPTAADFEDNYKIWNANRVSWADPYKIVNMNGHLVCLLGLITKQTMVDSNQSATKNLTFVDYDASVSYIMKLCQTELGDWFDKIESFVLLTHIESDQDSSGQPIGPAADLAKKLTMAKYNDKFSAVLSAHSHKIVAGSVINDYYGEQHPILVGQAETAGRKYVDLKLTFNNTQKVGSRFDSVASDDTISVSQVPICGGKESPTQEEAAAELKYIAEHPATKLVSKTVETYEAQKQKVKNKLGTVVAQTKFGLSNPISKSGDVGHKYFCSDDILDQMGAWFNLAQSLGFTSYFQPEIGDPTNNITQPCISFSNINSTNVEIPEPASPLHPSDILLKDLYNIQTYENTIYFGFLSIWQLANIIDYLLSGKTMFRNENNHDYMTDESGQLLPRNCRHDLRSNVRVDKSNPIVCCNDDDIDTSVMGKYCCYLCGPLQWYGMQFEIEHETDTEPYIDQEYRLKYIEPQDPQLKKDFPLIPAIRIFDPGNSSNIYRPETWKTAEDWLLNKDQNGNPKLIPIVVNSFVYEGGNDQSRLFKWYMEHNERKIDGRSYAVHHFSQLTRDMLLEYCHLTTQETTKWLYHFDVNMTLVKSLIIWPEPKSL